MADNRWALITGVSQGGLGDALTQQFLARGVSVVATSISLDLLSYLPQDQPRLKLLQLDVTSTSSISTAVSQVNELTKGRLDFLVNNAGYGYMMPLMDADIDKVKQNYDVNVFGLLAVTQAFFPLLRVAKGIVINQSSIAGLECTYQPFIGCYTSSKAAVCSLSNTLRLELKPFGIKVWKQPSGLPYSDFNLCRRSLPLSREMSKHNFGPMPRICRRQAYQPHQATYQSRPRLKR
jgi:1-acylglycerone phosphate reductase